MDWDAAYSNADHVADSATYPPRLKMAASAFRAEIGARARLDIQYGPADRERLDLFMPEGDPKGLAIFVHGGYWHRNDKNMYSHLAVGALARGWAVAVPGYTLCPLVRVHEITQEIRAAVMKAAELVEGPINLAGHSAGGHLVSRMLCTDVDLPEAVARRLRQVVSISGVHDLRPLLKTRMNDMLKLDEAEAVAESAALATPREGARIFCWVGAAELPEFVRQNKLLANIWTGLGAHTRTFEAPGKHHLNVVEDLADPKSLLVDKWLKN